jgi:ribosomal protein S18 acetylase RimI-like enzyme
VTVPSARDLFAATHLVRGEGRLEDGLAWFHSGAPHEELGGVLFAEASRIDDGRTAMAGRPALWHSWPGHDRFDIETDLLRRGFRFVEEEPVMVRDLVERPGPVAAPGGLRVREAADLDDLAAWVRAWTGTAPDALVVAALAATGLGAGRRVHHLLGELDGAVVGCSAAVIVEGAVAVEHVVTAAPHRGRGIGTVLTAEAVDVGRARGARHAVLTASPDGAGLYRRLGFVEEDRVRRFAEPGPAAPGPAVPESDGGA